MFFFKSRAGNLYSELVVYSGIHRVYKTGFRFGSYCLPCFVPVSLWFCHATEFKIWLAYNLILHVALFLRRQQNNLIYFSLNLVFSHSIQFSTGVWGTSGNHTLTTGSCRWIEFGLFPWHLRAWKLPCIPKVSQNWDYLLIYRFTGTISDCQFKISKVVAEQWTQQALPNWGTFQRYVEFVLHHTSTLIIVYWRF